MRIATIIARRELARARVLSASVLEHDPHSTVHVFVLDPLGDEADGEESFRRVALEQVVIEDFGRMAAYLDLEELREAVKPWLLRHLRELYRDETVMYVGADSLVCGPLEEVGRLAAEHGLLIWPRTGTPLPDDGRRPNEADLAGWGLHDPGLLALGPNSSHEQMFDWWVVRTREGRAPHGVAAAFERLQTVASEAHDVCVAGLGASFWNLRAASLQTADDVLAIDGQPLLLLRLEGFDFREPAQLSVAQDRLRAVDHPGLLDLLEDYAERLERAGGQELAEGAYGWDALPDGTILDRRLRDIYARAAVEGAVRHSPFQRPGMDEFYAWLAEPAPAGAAHGINRLCWLVREAQGELHSAYPDLDRPEQALGLIGWLNAYALEPGTLPRELVPSATDRQQLEERRRREGGVPWGVNVAGYFESELGVGEAARLTVAALDAAHVPLVPVRGRTTPPSRQGHVFATLPTSAAPFPVNLVCINADGLADFRQEVGEELFAQRYTIGMWWWEVSSIPEAWRAKFDLLDEVWVGSEHIARALTTESPVPVYTVTLPVLRPQIEPLARSAFGLPDGFLFLFMFDYHSVFERKNPLAAVEAFRAAFEPGSGASLVIKCINGEDDPANRARLRAAAERHLDIHLLEGYLTAAENHALIDAADCYVSLHRSEGFGLTPAEAMSLGKPVIATGYSGNLDYMTPRNAYLVDYEMCQIGAGNAPYPQQASWANPDVEHASHLMREVFEDRAAARERGARAASEIAQTHSLSAAGDSMRRRLDSLKARRSDWDKLASQVRSTSTISDSSRSLRSRLARWMARDQLSVLYAQIDELRLERELDARRTQAQLALLQAETLAALRAHERTSDD